MLKKDGKVLTIEVADYLSSVFGLLSPSKRGRAEKRISFETFETKIIKQGLGLSRYMTGKEGI